jgi:hypothetical protein
MRFLGRASAASIINVVLSFVRFGIAIGLMIAAVATLLIPFASSSGYRVTVPASFTVDGLAPLHGGRPGFGFEVGRNDGTEREHAPDNAARKRALLDRVDGSVTIDDASKAFVAANAVALMVIMIYALFILDQLRAVLKTLRGETHRCRRCPVRDLAGHQFPDAHLRSHHPGDCRSVPRRHAPRPRAVAHDLRH